MLERRVSTRPFCHSRTGVNPAGGEEAGETWRSLSSQEPRNVERRVSTWPFCHSRTGVNPTEKVGAR